MEQWDLSNFVNHHTLYFFEVLNSSREFLAFDPEEWHPYASFFKNIERLKLAKEVTDTAERGVALLKYFKGSVTRTEKDFQNLLVVSKIIAHLTLCKYNYTSEISFL